MRVYEEDDFSMRVFPSEKECFFNKKLCERRVKNSILNTKKALLQFRFLNSIYLRDEDDDDDDDAPTTRTTTKNALSF